MVHPDITAFLAVCEKRNWIIEKTRKKLVYHVRFNEPPPKGGFGFLDTGGPCWSLKNTKAIMRAAGWKPIKGAFPYPPYLGKPQIIPNSLYFGHRGWLVFRLQVDTFARLGYGILTFQDQSPPCPAPSSSK